MNGFELIELEEAGILGRLFGRRPKTNAISVINNILAARPLSEISAADVEQVLSDYLLPRDRAQEGLCDLYRHGLSERASRDVHLTDGDVQDLQRLRYILGLDDELARQAEIDVLREIYRRALKHALLDGVLSDAEKVSLEQATLSFGFSESERDGIYKDEVNTVIQQAFNEAVKDRRLTSEEEHHLTKVSTNLGVTVSHDDETRRLMERFKLFARIENGDIPSMQCSLHLQRGELCYAEFPSRLHELRTVTKRVNYSGPTGSIRIMKGLSYRYGSMSINRVTSEELRQLDAGTLYITSKRLLFNGNNKNVALPLKRIVHFTTYSDGLRVEKDSGRDQYFLGDGDLELLAVILEATLNKVR